MKCYQECEYTDMESAIRAGSCFYFDKELYQKESVSGGAICPKCNKWTSRPRKRKFPMHTWINDCEKCEIKDDFQRMLHNFNRSSSDIERTMYNNWLHQVRHHLQEIDHLFIPEDSLVKLKELIHKLPFFEGL